VGLVGLDDQPAVPRRERHRRTEVDREAWPTRRRLVEALRENGPGQIRGGVVIEEEDVHRLGLAVAVVHALDIDTVHDPRFSCGHDQVVSRLVVVGVES
jgi:hypothetical protein